MIQKILYLIPSCFFIGNIKGGGTIASLLFCLLLLVFKLTDIQMIMIFSAVLFFSAVSIEYSDLFKGDDKRIVADEFIGMTVSMLFLPKTLLITSGAFILFRYFDIAKPLFIKNAEKVKGPAGIILDDILSGIAANVLVRTILWAV